MKRSIVFTALLIAMTGTETFIAMESLSPSDQFKSNYVKARKAESTLNQINTDRRTQDLQPISDDEQDEIYMEMMENSDYNDEKPL